jgi:hypothetical protein
MCSSGISEFDEILLDQPPSCELISTNLCILYRVLRGYYSEHVLLATLLHFPGQQQLIQYEVCFLEVENDILCHS